MQRGHSSGGGAGGSAPRATVKLKKSARSDPDEHATEDRPSLARLVSRGRTIRQFEGALGERALRCRTETQATRKKTMPTTTRARASRFELSEKSDASTSFLKLVPSTDTRHLTNEREPEGRRAGM